MAGAGKTTTLAVIREGAEANGYRVEGFAPTSRAAQKLGEAGIETSTLQLHLAKGQQADTGERRLYILDESSLASTKQMHGFVTRLHPNNRILLVGDTRQHEAVEAGRPFAQLQEAGMRTAKLDEIVRQRDAALKQIVEQLAQGKVGEAVQGLERQGRVHEVKDQAERIAAIAKEYARQPENTLVVSPDNRSRAEINQAIRTELQEIGVVGREEHRTDILVPRQDLLNNCMAYVAISRGAQDAQIFTSDCQQLPQVLSREVSHQSAHVPEVQQQTEGPQIRLTGRELVEQHKRRWSPLNETLPEHEAKQFHWQQESGTIQSYKHTQTGRYIHIDGQDRTFHNQNREAITAKQALDSAIPKGRSTHI